MFVHAYGYMKDHVLNSNMRCGVQWRKARLEWQGVVDNIRVKRV